MEYTVSKWVDGSNREYETLKHIPFTPVAVAVRSDGVLLVADGRANQIRRCGPRPSYAPVPSGRAGVEFGEFDNTLFVGGEDSHGGHARAELVEPRAICVNTAHRARFYVSDRHTIWVYENGSVRALLRAGEYSPYGLALTGDRCRLYFVNRSGTRAQLNRLQLSNRSVLTVAGSGKLIAGPGHERDGVGHRASFYQPTVLCWAIGGGGVKSSTILYVTCDASIRRFNVDTAEVSTVPIGPTPIFPVGLCCTPSGHLLVSCALSSRLCSVEPRTGAVVHLHELYLRSPPLPSPGAVALVDAEGCLAVCADTAVLKVPLPDRFWKPAAPPPDTSASNRTAPPTTAATASASTLAFVSSQLRRQSNA